MRNRGWGKSLLVVLFLGLILVLESGYVVQIMDDGTTVQRWFIDDYPIEIQIWDGFNDQLPSITEGSNPRGAIKEALESWVRTTSLPYVLGEDKLRGQLQRERWYQPGDHCRHPHEQESFFRRDDRSFLEIILCHGKNRRSRPGSGPGFGMDHPGVG